LSQNPLIFGAFAPSYYEKGVPVIPLHFHDKRPIPFHWQNNHDQLPSADTQRQWLETYGECNMGVVLGKQSRMMMMDIDTPDQRLVDVITSVLPKSPWVRIGAKGMVLAYRWNGLRTFRIKDLESNTIVECLSDRTQCVLPPSIHPDTQRPYIANVDLLDVIDFLPSLDLQIESILRGALKRSSSLV
jgi:hypothetical protein